MHESINNHAKGYKEPTGTFQSVSLPLFGSEGNSSLEMALNNGVVYFEIETRVERSKPALASGLLYLSTRPCNMNTLQCGTQGPFMKKDMYRYSGQKKMNKTLTATCDEMNKEPVGS